MDVTDPPMISLKSFPIECPPLYNDLVPIDEACGPDGVAKVCALRESFGPDSR